MSEILLLRLSADSNECSWQRIDRLGNLLGPARDGSLAMAADSIRAVPSGVAVWCVVPQEAVRAIEMSVPVQDRRRARQAALYAIEDRVLTPLDDTHVAQADRERNGRWPQVAVSKRQMQAWITRLQEIGLTPTRMICESELLPQIDALRILWEPDRVLAISRDGRTLSCDSAQATKVIQRLRDEDTAIHVWCSQDHDPGPALAELGATGDQIECVTLDRPVVAWFADQARARKDLIDLLQGDYRSTDTGERDLRPWAWAGMAAAAVFVLQLVTWAVEIRELSQRQESLLQEMQTVWHGAMGPSARFDRYQARSRFEIALRGRGDGTDGGGTDRFLNMVQVLANASAGAGVDVQGLVLASDSLQVLIEAPDVSAVQRLASTVTDRSGSAVDIGDVDASGSTVSAQISINMAGGD
jgi:type II secretion system protein L